MSIFTKSKKEYVIDFFKKTWDFLKKIKILKLAGYIFIIWGAMGIVVDKIMFWLILWDSQKFEEIVNYFYNVNIFDYISRLDFFSIYAGLTTMDILGALVMVLFGIYLVKGHNYFKYKIFKIQTWLYMVVLFVIALFIFAIGFYNAMPDIMEPLKIIDEQNIKFNQNCNQDLNWKIERRKLDNGYYEQSYYNSGDLEQIYWESFHQKF